MSSAQSSLNEGRGVNPGDTVIGDGSQRRLDLRSTKAGA